MLINLAALPYYHAKELLFYCYDNNIDYERANALVAAWYASDYTDILKWSLDVPEEHLAHLALKWEYK